MTQGSVPPRLPVAAVFDWDGTLADTLGVILAAERRAMRSIGVEVTGRRLRELYSPDWREKYRALGIPESLWEQASRTWTERMIAARPRTFPWSRRALRMLHARGVHLGVVTASYRSIVGPNVERFGLDGLFTTIVCADDVARTKPHPEGLDLALGSLGVRARESVYVGDTPADLEMARGAGVPFVAIAGTTSDAVFAALGADRVWSSVAEWTASLLGEPAPGAGRR